MTVRVWNQTIDPKAFFAGTLTCVARTADDPARLVAVAAAHVLAPLTEAGVAWPQEGDEVVFELSNRTRLNGRLWFWSELQREIDGFENQIDAALVDIDESDAVTLLKELSQPAARSEPRPGAPVRFTGVASGPSVGSFHGLHSNEPVAYGVLGGTVASVVFMDSLKASLRAAPGDSGALMVSGLDGVGVLVAAEGETCRFL
ncbi:MAG: hypothetical protein Q8M07_13490, partial [Prosthecobacter sp.]|nr:hypothetical protein [Prosthecobacter sp.]